MSNIEQRIEQMAKNLAVASIFSQHPQQDDDYDRIMQGDYLTGNFQLTGFQICEDYECDSADSLLERLESEYDKLKDFAKEALAVKQVWKLAYDWDGGTLFDVIIGNEQQAKEAFIANINLFLTQGKVSDADIETIDEATGECEHTFWKNHRPFIYYAQCLEVNHE